MFSVRSLTSVAKSAMRSIALWREAQGDPFGRQQRGVLLDQRTLRLGEDADEVVADQRFELHPDREAPLKFRNQVGRLGHVKGAGGNEQDVIGLHHPVFRIDRRPFDDREDVALDTLAADIRTMAAFAAGHLVDLVDEDDPRLLDAVDGGARHGLHVDQLRLFFLREHLERLGHAQLPLLRPAGEEPAHHVLDVDVDFFDRRTGDDLERRK